jgi:SmpA/OmlA family protein
MTRILWRWTTATGLGGALVGLLLVGSGGCASLPETRQLRPGMTQEQVLAVLGPPTQTTYQQGLLAWKYRRGLGAWYCVFAPDGLIAWFEGEEAWRTNASALRWAYPPPR